MNYHDVRDWLWLTVALMSWLATYLAVSLRRALRPHIGHLAALERVSEDRTRRIEEAAVAVRLSNEETALSVRLSNEVKMKSDELVREEIRIMQDDNRRVVEASHSVLEELMGVARELRLRHPTATNHQH
ncbi:MAG TPA: hypothetical protein VGQ44_17300 [Gemmatimonadaceae bacterium]|jgi:hypothetical protein|nr:hypothetical protein [Gemmatimonadaceae bacterium]